MFDIGDKDKLISTITSRVANYYPYVSNPHSSGTIEWNVHQIACNAAQQIGKQYAEQIVREIITNLYTYSEFEKDLGIK